MTEEKSYRKSTVEFRHSELNLIVVGPDERPAAEDIQRLTSSARGPTSGNRDDLLRLWLGLRQGWWQWLGLHLADYLKLLVLGGLLLAILHGEWLLHPSHDRDRSKIRRLDALKLLI